MNEYRPRKRARSESDDRSEGPSTGARRKDEDFWYEDGNITLATRDVDFRVFKGILAEHSPVFKDMFSLPQPSDGEAGASGPVVHLSDSPDDVRALLHVCMPKTDNNPFAHDHPSYETIAGVIRLGHKYEVARIVDYALDYLKQYYTDDYTRWQDQSMMGPPRFHTVHAIGVINLARLTGCETILPTALFQCCQLGKELVSGFERSDGTLERLSTHDLELCVVARANLMKESVDMALRLSVPVLWHNCTRRAQCAAVLSLSHLVNSGIVNAANTCTANPFEFGALMLDSIHMYLCQHCGPLLHDRDAYECRSVWVRLPSILGLRVPEVGNGGGDVAPQD